MKRVKCVVALLLVAALFAACGAGGTPATGGTTAAAPVAGGTTAAGAPTTAAAAEDSGEVEEVKILMDFNIMDGIDSLTDNKYVDFIQENTGVKIVMDNPGPAGYNDKLNITMASGAEIDAFMASRDQIMRFAQDGIIIDQTPYITDAEKYPNIAQYMAPETWLPVQNDEGTWGFPYARFDAFFTIMFAQKAWVDKLGLSQESPKTLDELYEVMRAFTFDDPDGNGQDDTFGLLCSSGLGDGGRAFRAIFDSESYKIIDGVVTPPEITENYKMWLKYLAKLVEEKIMDPEFPTAIVAVYMDKLKTYKYGLTTYFWHANQLPEYDQGTVHENWLSWNLPEKYDGSGPAKYVYQSMNRNYAGIPTTSTKVDALMRVYDWTCSQDEGERWLYLGVEGDEYEMVNGEPKILQQRNSLHWMFTMVSPGMFTDNVKKYLALTYPGPTVDRLGLSTADGMLDELGVSLPYFPDLANFDLGKVVEEYRVKAVLGDVDIDATWEDYVSKYKAAGGEAAMKFWTDAYNESNAAS